MELIGRAHEVDLARELVLSRSLVTITGPGGIGKTALAAALARSMRALFDHGVVTVDLTATDHPDGVPELVAGRLGVADFAAVVSLPWSRDMLIVLDNCEHVLDSAAGVAAQLAGLADPPRLLATSRAPLEIAGEAIVSLRPLAVPAEVHDGGAESDALQLLRARALDQGIELSPHDLPDASEICRQLDGMPLALEIAAARFRARSIPEVLADLQRQPHALDRHRYRGNQNQRSIIDLVHWSTDLLDPETAQVFVSLAVFAGPFTTKMAANFIDTDVDGASVYLDELVASSLIVGDTAHDEAWFRLLHPIRAVARHELEITDQRAMYESRWVDLVTNLVFDATKTADTGWEQRHLERLLALYPNASAALRWLLDNEDEGSGRGLSLVAALWGVVHQRHAGEVAALGEAALAKWSNRDHRGWAAAAATVATCWNLLGEHDRAVDLAQEAMSHVGPTSYARAALLRVLALAYRAQGAIALAKQFFDEAALCATATGFHGLALELRSDSGYVTARLGDRQGGLAEIDAVRAEALERGASINAAWALLCRGLVMIDDDPRTSLSILRSSLIEAQAIHYLAGISAALRGLALAHLCLGEDVAAATTASDLLDELATRGEIGDLRMALDIVAELAERTGDPAWADLASTAQALPVTAASVPADSELFGRAQAAGGEILSRADAFVACRRSVNALIDGDSNHDEQPSVSADAAARTDSVDRAICELHLEGEYWRVTFAGQACLLRSSKGLVDLAELLEHPGREVACADLAGSTVSTPSNQEAIDRQGRSDLERRIRDLHEEIEDASDNNDLGRVERLQLELDAIVHHLSTALGLGGRHRAISAEAERARSTVTHRIRSTIRKLEVSHPPFAAHLHASVNTGMFCSYRPPTETRWTVLRADNR